MIYICAKAGPAPEIQKPHRALSPLQRCLLRCPKKCISVTTASTNDLSRQRSRLACSSRDERDLVASYGTSEGEQCRQLWSAETATANAMLQLKQMLSRATAGQARPLTIPGFWQASACTLLLLAERPLAPSDIAPGDTAACPAPPIVCTHMHSWQTARNPLCKTQGQETGACFSLFSFVTTKLEHATGQQGTYIDCSHAPSASSEAW